ncbi:MAG: DUF4174 domain-containing protein [Caldilineaceae bacterium]
MSAVSLAQDHLLAVYQGQKRLLLIFAPSSTQADYEQQHTLLRGHEAECEERDLLVFHLFADGVSYAGEVQVDAESAAELRRRFDVANRLFQLILIGKDGGVKWQTDRPTPLAKIFVIIDSMPMRQREICAAHENEVN